MATLLIQFLPLALAAVSPVLMMAVIMLLGTSKGLQRSLAFTLGKYLVYFGWGVLFLGLSAWIASSGEFESLTIPPAILLILGILLLVLAGRGLLGEDDPDDSPPKWMTLFEKPGTAALFGIGAAMSLVQIRYVVLVAAGVTLMLSAGLSSVENLVALLILALCMVWPLLLPIAIYVLAGDRASEAIDSMNQWLTKNQRWINFGFLSVVGVLLVVGGLSGLGVIGT